MSKRPVVGCLSPNEFDLQLEARVAQLRERFAELESWPSFEASLTQQESDFILQHNDAEASRKIKSLRTGLEKLWQDILNPNQFSQRRKEERKHSRRKARTHRKADQAPTPPGQKTEEIPVSPTSEVTSPSDTGTEEIDIRPLDDDCYFGSSVGLPFGGWLGQHGAEKERDEKSELAATNKLSDQQNDFSNGAHDSEAAVTEQSAAMLSAAKPSVAMPPVAEPSVAMPPIAKPSVVMPPITEPSVAMPPVAEPSVAMPPVTEASVAMPSVVKSPVPDSPAAVVQISEPQVVNLTVPGSSVAKPPVAMPFVINPSVAEQPVAGTPVSEHSAAKASVINPPSTEPYAAESPTQVDQTALNVLPKPGARQDSTSTGRSTRPVHQSKSPTAASRKYARQLRQLKDMGYHNENELIALLNFHRGNLQNVLDSLQKIRVVDSDAEDDQVPSFARSELERAPKVLDPMGSSLGEKYQRCSAAYDELLAMGYTDEGSNLMDICLQFNGQIGAIVDYLQDHSRGSVMHVDT